METKDILKKLRKNKGFNSAQEFCDAADISFNTYQNYESGKRVPTTEILMKLADFYGVTTDYLLGRSSKPPHIIDENRLKELEKILIEQYMELDEKQREMALDFLRRAIEKEEKRKAALADGDPDYGPFTKSAVLGEMENNSASEEKGAG